MGADPIRSGRRGLFVDSALTRRIVGVPRSESDALLEFLFRHVAEPQFTCRFRWRSSGLG
jgi:taurine dioxygenase